MTISRRTTLQSLLLGGGYLALRSLATGIPAAVLARGTRALADTPGAPSGADPAKAQYIILSTSGLGDPINANAPGTYADTSIVHCPDPTMAPAQMTLGGQQTTAALPWTQLPAAVRARTTFWHLATNTPVHPKQPDVLELMGATAPTEMLPSLLARQLAPALGTVQAQPITLGALSPSEGLSYQGQALPIIPPLALKATLASPAGPLTRLQGLRDQTLAQLDTIYRDHATIAQRNYLDALILSQSEVRNIRQDLLALLDSISDNSPASQLTAALALIQMNIAPVMSVHIPFGGDNHADPGFQKEATETVAGVAAIASLFAQLPAALADRVTFMTLNVFGRTIGPGNTAGRQHNENHQVSITIGKPFKGGIVGGVAPVAGDYGALAIDSASGAGGPGGDIAPGDSLAAFGKTMLAAVGVDGATIDGAITGGKVIGGALA